MGNTNTSSLIINQTIHIKRMISQSPSVIDCVISLRLLVINIIMIIVVAVIITVLLLLFPKLTRNVSKSCEKHCYSNIFKHTNVYIFCARLVFFI